MKKGFTIVELLVVMAIIGLLTALLLIGIPAVQRQARNTTRQNDMRSIKGSLEQFYGRQKVYPAVANFTFPTTTTFKITTTGYAMNDITMGNAYVKAAAALVAGATGCTVNNVWYVAPSSTGVTGTYDLLVCLEAADGTGYVSDNYGNQ